MSGSTPEIAGARQGAGVPRDVPTDAVGSPFLGNPKLILFVLWLVMFVSGSQVMIIAPILPEIGEQLRIPERLLGTLVTADAVMVGLFAFVAGPVSDRVGRRRILLLGTSFLAVALATHALAVSYATLLMARAFAGAAGGILSGAAIAYVGDYFPYERRGWATGWVMSGMSFSQIVGIPVGTLLAARFGFRAPFLLFGLLIATTAILVWRGVPQPNVARNPSSLSPLGIFRSYVALLRRPEILAAAVIFFLMFGGNSLFLIFLPVWLTAELGASGGQIASMFFVGGLASVISGPRAGKLSDRIGRKKLIIGASLALSVAMGLAPFLIRGFTAAYVFFFVTMLLFSARIGPFQALNTALVSPQQRGALMSLTVGLGQLGFGIGSAFAGLLYERGGFVWNSTGAAASIAVVAWMVWQLLPEPELRHAGWSSGSGSVTIASPPRLVAAAPESAESVEV